MNIKLILQDLYVNLAVETKRYMDVAATGVGVADARNALLAFWDAMPLNEAFEDVGKEDFHEVMNRSKREKKARKAPDLSGMDRFRVVGLPPAKTSTKPGTSRSAAHEDDNEDDELPDLGIS